MTPRDPLTQKEIDAVKLTVEAVADTIKELGHVPAGHLYAALMGHMTLSQFEAIISLLIDQRRVRRDPSHLLTWIEGGEKP